MAMGRRVNDTGECPFRKFKGTNIALEQVDGRVLRQVGSLDAECVGMARQKHNISAQAQTLIRADEGFDQPRTDEPGAAGDKHGLATQGLPPAGGVGQYVFDIFGERRMHTLFQGNSAEFTAVCRRSYGHIFQGARLLAHNWFRYS